MSDIYDIYGVLSNQVKSKEDITVKVKKMNNHMCFKQSTQNSTPFLSRLVSLCNGMLTSTEEKMRRRNIKRESYFRNYKKEVLQLLMDFLPFEDKLKFSSVCVYTRRLFQNCLSISSLNKLDVYSSIEKFVQVEINKNYGCVFVFKNDVSRLWMFLNMDEMICIFERLCFTAKVVSLKKMETQHYKIGDNIYNINDQVCELICSADFDLGANNYLIPKRLKNRTYLNHLLMDGLVPNKVNRFFEKFLLSFKELKIIQFKNYKSLDWLLEKVDVGNLWLNDKLEHLEVLKFQNINEISKEVLTLIQRIVPLFGIKKIVVDNVKNFNNDKLKFLVKICSAKRYGITDLSLLIKNNDLITSDVFKYNRYNLDESPWKALRSLEFESCNTLVNFNKIFMNSVFELPKNLDYLRIERCKSISSGFIKLICLSSSLKTLIIRHCEKVDFMNFNNETNRSVKNVVIEDCNSLNIDSFICFSNCFRNTEHLSILHNNNFCGQSELLFAIRKLDLKYFTNRESKFIKSINDDKSKDARITQSFQDFFVKSNNCLTILKNKEFSDSKETEVKKFRKMIKKFHRFGNLKVLSFSNDTDNKIIQDNLQNYIEFLKTVRVLLEINE